MDKEEAKRVFDIYNQVFKTKRYVTDIEFKATNNNKEEIFLETSIYLKNDIENKIIGFSGVVRDISKRKQLELIKKEFNTKLEDEVVKRTKELNTALENQKLYLDQIVKSSQFKTEFLATMSHELRTPLNAIIGFTDLLLEGTYGELNEEQLDFLNDIKSSAEHQFEMIKDILDISKIEAGQLSLKKSKFSLNTLIEQVNSTLKPLYLKKKLAFKVKGLDYEREIQGDPIRIKEILYNLLSNAIKFTLAGQVTFDVKENSKEYIFLVRDTGIGIAKKDNDLIFKEFKRVDSPFIRSVPGTGLGLSLTKRLVELHGGEISFTSVLGKGTDFIFTIPKENN